MGELDDALRDAQRQTERKAWYEDFGGSGERVYDEEFPYYDILADTISRMPASAYFHGHVVPDLDGLLVFLLDSSRYGAETPDDWTGRRRHRAIMRRRKKMGIDAQYFRVLSPPAPEVYLPREGVSFTVLVLGNGAVKTLDSLPQRGSRAEFTRACAYALERAMSTGKPI
jgi:hypothetical protein